MSVDSDKSREELVAELEAVRQRVAELEADSEHKRAEERLRSLSHMVEQSSDAIVQTDENFNIVYVNNAAEKLFGWRLEELRGKTPEIFNAEPVPSEYQDAIYRKITAGEPFLGEALNKRKDGSTFQCQVKISPILDGQGRISGYMGLQRDITDFKRAEEALRESEGRYRNLYKNSPVMLHSIDRKGRLVDVSDYWLETLGYGYSEVLGRPSTDFLTEESRKFAREKVIPEFFRVGFCKDVPYQMVKKNGEVIDVSLSAVTERDEDSNIMRSLAVITNITERKRAEEELRESESRLWKVVAKSPYPMCIVDQSGDLQFYNQKFIETYGYTLETVRTAEQWWMSAYPDPDYRERVKASWEAAAAEAQATGMEIAPQEWRMRCSDGTYKDVQFKLVSLDEISVIAMLDVTPFRALELELRNSKEAAEAANLAKSEFLANMSHEIRTPLNGVLGMLQVLQESPLDGGQEECLHAALNSGRSLIRIISDILDLSRIESGKMDIREEEFEVRGVMHSIQGAFMNEVARKGLTVSFHIDPTLPAVVKGDSGRLRQILFNLVGNAIKFTPKGEVKVRVSPEGVEPDASPLILCFEVSDTGIGIPEEMVGHIFEPFTQVDGSHTREYGGTGLGLAIVKRLLDLMGGTIQLESEEGVGAIVRFRVPVQSLTEERTEREAREEAVVCAYKLKILLAEDDLSNQLVAKRMLEKQGHTVVCAATGREALAVLDFAVLEKDKFDLILMDVQMPEMDGTEATREIRKDERFRYLPIIALTAHAMAGDRERFLEAGMNDYLSKPVEIDELRQTLDRAMAGRRRG